MNELYLDDLREKTLRGQKGQKARGFMVGEATCGYKSVPVSEMRTDRRGRPRPDGYRMTVEPTEVAIVKALNAECIRGRRRIRKGWSPATVSRMFRNEKYIGRWGWNSTETRRDPRTGGLRKFPKPDSEWHLVVDESLRIVPQETWNRVRDCWLEIARSWPRRGGQRGFEGRQRSYVESHPPHLLSGAMRCGVWGGAVGQVSGKGQGYYGCLGSARRACDNRLLVPRRLAERKAMEALREHLAGPSAIRYLLERVEAEVKRLHGHVPEQIKLKRASLADEERRKNSCAPPTPRVPPRFPHTGKYDRGGHEMATDPEIQKFVQHHHGFIPRPGWIVHIKEVHGVPTLSGANRPRRDRDTEPCRPEKREAIEEALRHFGTI